jgi:aminoglycoside 2'-N-acetyltransferase I
MSSRQLHQLEIKIVNSQLLSQDLRVKIISLCNRAYEEDLEPLFKTFVGATHVLGYYNQLLVSHALWVTRYLQAGAAPLMRTAYVEAVATEPDYRGRGFASNIMGYLLDEIQDYDLAALSPFSVKYYKRLGWECWRGALFIRTEDGLISSPKNEKVMIFRLPKTPALDLNTSLSAEWREGELW